MNVRKINVSKNRNELQRDPAFKKMQFKKTTHTEIF